MNLEIRDEPDLAQLIRSPLVNSHVHGPGKAMGNGLNNTMLRLELICRGERNFASCTRLFFLFWF
jgi:hypothetical protein